jgi:saccharopine dehydrogenase-like NADP-dependent oxidoreductase
MAKKIIVLGAGMVGSAIAIDLSQTHDVVVADLNKERLQQLTGISTQVLDISKPNVLEQTIADFDLVICAVPGFLGFNTLKRIIECKKNVVDISFFPENALELNELAKKNNVTAIVDCGVAPGLDNLILGYANSNMKVTDFECLVGGLPKEKKWPFFYKAPFSPIDVIEEYTRPARYVENGHLVTKPAMSDCEYVEIPKVGTLESFNTDGLRSLIHTMPHIPNMKEKTLRYPGHISTVRALKESGFFSTEKITIGEIEMSPLSFTSQILFNEWKLKETDEEFTVMTIKIKGVDLKSQKNKVVMYYLYDEYNKETKTSSMARTTGYTAAAVANALLNNKIDMVGVLPPELLGANEECSIYVLDYLRKRGVNLSVSSHLD